LEKNISTEEEVFIVRYMRLPEKKLSGFSVLMAIKQN
jgi:hypothetical protein